MSVCTLYDTSADKLDTKFITDHNIMVSISR